jgi:predicted small metal-binding protein
MAKAIRCRDVGSECEGVIRAENERDAVDQAVQHARDVHGLTEISNELAGAVCAAIRYE